MGCQQSDSLSPQKIDKQTKPYLSQGQDESILGIIPTNFDEQINQKKLLLQKVEINMIRAFQDCQIIKTEALKGQIFDKITNYSLNRNKFKELQFLLSSYQKVYHQTEFDKITEKVRQFGQKTHRFTNELHFDHQRSCQIAKILFQDRFLSTMDLNKPQLKIEEGFLGLSRRVFSCCEKDLNSFAFLIIQMIGWASIQKMTAGQVDDSLQKILKHLQKHYPATQESGERIQLKEFDFEKMKDEKVIIKLKGLTGKQKWSDLDQKILQMAKLAEQQEYQLKQITKKSCLEQNGSSFKTGTKIKGQQSIERVKQKLVKKIFDEKENEEPYKKKFKQMHKNLNMQDFLKKEKQQYDKFVELWITNQTQIQFTVDDMVRGKCMFDSVGDIYSSAQKIIANCKKKRIGIVKINNRLNKKTSDLVFKLKMKTVVAQFQLAVKFNAVKNEFNHKIYELLRSPGFSVIQTVFQNKEKSQRFLWDMQSVLNKNDKLSSTIKSEYAQYREKKNLQLRWERCVMQLKYQVKKDKITDQKYLQNRRFWTAIFYKQCFQYKLAIQQLNQALKTAQKEQLRQQILKSQGQIHYNLGDYPQALKFYNQSFEIKEKIKGKDSIDCAETLNNIGNVYKKQGNYFQALKIYNRCFEIQQKIKGKQSIYCAASLNNIGSVYEDQGNYTQALKFYNQCLEIKQKIKGKDSIDCAGTLNNIGNVYKKQGNYPQTLKLYNQCLEIQQKIKGKDSIDCARTLNNIGSVYDDRGNCPQALKFYNRCLQIKQKIKGKDSIDCAGTLNNIGNVYYKQFNYAQALKFYKNCLEIKQRLNGNDNIESAETQENIGSVYNKQGNYPQALKFYNRCLEIKQKIKGKDSIDCAVTLNNIGNVRRNQANYPQALKCYNRCLEIQQNIKGKQSIDCAGSLNNIGSVYSDQGNYNQALKFYNRCLEIRQKIKGKDSIDCAGTQENIGIAYHNQGNYPQALRYYNRCLEIKQKIKGKGSIDCAGVLNNIGLVYKSQGNYSQAANFYQRVCHIFDSTLGVQHPKSKLARKNLEQVRTYIK